MTSESQPTTLEAATGASNAVVPAAQPTAQPQANQEQELITVSLGKSLQNITPWQHCKYSTPYSG